MTIGRPAVRAWARGVVVAEVDGVDDPRPVALALARLFSRLDEQLSRIIGTVGFRALLRRSLHLARGQRAWLADVGVDEAAPGVLTGLDGALGREGRDEVVDGVALVVANVVELLCTFIGQELALRLVREVWPDIDLPGTEETES